MTAERVEDPLTVEDLFLAVDLAELGCVFLADEIESADSHDDAACKVMAYRELLEAASASPEAFKAILDRIVTAADLNFEACVRDEQRRHEEAKRAGKAARDAGLIAPEDIELIAELRARQSDWADGFEECASQEEVERLKALIRRTVAPDDAPPHYSE